MRRIIAVCALSIILCATNAYAVFDSGSTGVLGNLSPEAGTITTITIPPSGLLNYSIINIPQNATVKFVNISSYNSPVYLLAAGDVYIGGTIDVSGTASTQYTIGKGGPGGYDGGYAGPKGSSAGANPGGDGLGPGGGHHGIGGDGGGGGFGTDGMTGIHQDPGEGGVSYGNERLLPLIGGSGGGGAAGDIYGNPSSPGGGGGGAIVIASSTKITVDGEIRANGGNSWNGSTDGGGGSGGAIKLIANNVYGDGNLLAKGGTVTGGTGNGGKGRIRIEAYENYRTASSDPPYTVGTPTSIYLTNVPILKIDSIGGTAAPQNPSGSYGQPDVTLAYTTTNPVTVAVTATNVPLPSNVIIKVIPQYGDPLSYSATLSGGDQSSNGSADVSLDLDYTCVIVAETTFTIQQALYFDGEKIEKVRLSSTMGDKSKTVYITESGKEIKGELIAGLIR